MTIKYNSMLKENIRIFLYSLEKMKTKITEEENFNFILSEIHQKFLILTSLLGKELEIDYQTLSETEKEGDFINYSLNKFKCLYHNEHGILTIETGCKSIDNFIITDLRKYPVEQQRQRAEKLLSIYQEYENVNCDFCGEYILMSDFSTPIGRSYESDFILAYHLKCKNEKYKQYDRSAEI